MVRNGMLLTVLIAGSACGETGSPVRPSVTSPPAVQQSAMVVGTPQIVSFSISGQRVLGQYRYWPEFTLDAGLTDIVITKLTFRLVDVEFTGGIVPSMTRAVAGQSWFAFGGLQLELVASVAASKASVTVQYTSRDGRSREVTSSAEILPLLEGEPQAALAITRFTVDQWTRPGGGYSYWPRLTLAETTGLSAVTVTRVQFTMLDDGFSWVPTLRSGWRIPPGTSRDVYHETWFGAVALELGSSRLTDRVEVLISYVDDAGRARDVTAIANVEPLKEPF